MYAYEIDIEQSGDITVNGNEVIEGWIASTGSGTGKLSNITYTNSGQFIVGYRYDQQPNGAGLATEVGNHIRVYNNTPAQLGFSINDLAVEPFILQDNGYPEFTNAYTGVKDAPFWGVNGLAQVLHPETLEVYTINQLPPYDLTLTTSVSSSNDWLSSAAHCSNIEFEIQDNPDCGLTYFPAFFLRMIII